VTIPFSSGHPVIPQRKGEILPLIYGRIVNMLYRKEIYQIKSIGEMIMSEVIFTTQNDVLLARTSGDINLMLKVANVKASPIDRHFLLQNIVKIAYKLRKDQKYRDICIEYAEKHLQEFPSIAKDLKWKIGYGTLPRVSTFQHYATLLTENKEYEKAIAICEKAIKYGLEDGTKAGYEGRIARIKKAMEK
ncbi:MAG: hypothetical protein ABRQ39_31415, partial [Candidatus Eremiobacterota bacterium]